MVVAQPRQAWGAETESHSIDATSVYKLLFPQAASAAEDRDIPSPAKTPGEIDMYSLLFTKALPGSVSTALSAAHTQLAGSSAAPHKTPQKAPASELLRVLQQQPAELLSSSSVHGGSFSGLREFRQVKQGLARANSARRDAPVAKSPPRPKANDFITRTERAKQEQATAEAEAAVEAQRAQRAREEVTQRQREREEAAQRRLREEKALRREDETRVNEKRGAPTPHSPHLPSTTQPYASKVPRRSIAVHPNPGPDPDPFCPPPSSAQRPKRRRGRPSRSSSVGGHVRSRLGVRRRSRQRGRGVRRRRSGRRRSRRCCRRSGAR